MPTCWIIAGPNGAGKTTFALQYLPQIAQCNRFINADLIAAEHYQTLITSKGIPS